MRALKLLKVFLVFLCLFSLPAKANKHPARPDHHAPIGVMRDHIHKKGEYMLSYRHKIMGMKGVRRDDKRISSDEVLDEYNMSPLKMEMKMHMLGLMYGLTNRLTLAVSGSAIEKDMKMLNRGNQTINRESSGFGDSRLNAMYQFFKNSNNRAQFNLGASIPSGNIKQNSKGVRLAYPMQLGSGSYEALPGVSYSGFQNSYSYGAQLNGVFRLDDNNIGYRLGDSYNATVWTAKKLNQSFSLSSRLNYVITDKIRGADASLNTAMSPVNNASSSGGRRLDFLVGTNFISQNGFFKGHRLSIEGGIPLYQKLNGTALETNYKLTLGWQKVF